MVVVVVGPHGTGEGRVVNFFGERERSQERAVNGEMLSIRTLSWSPLVVQFYGRRVGHCTQVSR